MTTAHSKITEVYGLKFGTPGSLQRDDEIHLEITPDATNIIKVSHGNQQICQLVLRVNGFVDMVSPGQWHIPVGYITLLGNFGSPFEFNTLLSIASHANLCYANN